MVVAEGFTAVFSGNSFVSVVDFLLIVVVVAAKVRGVTGTPGAVCMAVSGVSGMVVLGIVVTWVSGGILTVVVLVERMVVVVKGVFEVVVVEVSSPLPPSKQNSPGSVTIFRDLLFSSEIWVFFL